MTNRSDEGSEPPTRSLRVTRTRQVRAEALLLESVVTQRPLPGIDRVVTFPDLVPTSVREQAVSSTIESHRGWDFHLRSASSTTRRSRHSSSEHELPVLRFVQAEVVQGKITVRLQLSIALPNDDPIPIEGIVSTFTTAIPSPPSSRHTSWPSSLPHCIHPPGALSTAVAATTPGRRRDNRTR